MNDRKRSLDIFERGKKIIAKGYSAIRGKTGANSKKTNIPWVPILNNSRPLWESTLQNKGNGKKILVAISMGGYKLGTIFESSLAVALSLRGTDVDVLLCDGVLPGCQQTEIAMTPPDKLLALSVQPRCSSCFAFGSGVFDPLGLNIYRYSDFLTASDRKNAADIAERIPFNEIENFTWNNLAVGEHAIAGALRYFARGNLTGEPYAERIARMYLKSSLLTASVVINLLKKKKYDVACFNHGIYVPMGIIGEVCRNNGVRVVNWNPGYRSQRFIFSHGTTYHHTMPTEPTDVWENMILTPEMNQDITEYLKSRWQGSQDWISFLSKSVEDNATISQLTGIDFSKKTVSLLTSVMWDARLHYKTNAFPDMLDWVYFTIEYFIQHPELQLVIRVHPAEAKGAVPSRQRVVEEVNSRFPHLPENIILVPPESPASTYAIVERSNAAIIYNTKTGIEISSMGIPVIVAGEAWIRGKGFSRDASSPDEYRRLLDQLPLKTGLNHTELERAQKYAYHFFFRRMIPLLFITPEFKLNISTLDELKPGVYPGLDVICDGILKGTPFIYPAEKIDTR